MNVTFVKLIIELLFIHQGRMKCISADFPLPVSATIANKVCIITKVGVSDLSPRNRIDECCWWRQRIKLARETFSISEDCADASALLVEESTRSLEKTRDNLG